MVLDADEISLSGCQLALAVTWAVKETFGN
jgi:hypothetical protein